jgi:hypothetical protein
MVVISQWGGRNIEREKINNLALVVCGNTLSTRTNFELVAISISAIFTTTNALADRPILHNGHPYSTLCGLPRCVLTQRHPPFTLY